MKSAIAVTAVLLAACSPVEVDSGFTRSRFPTVEAFVSACDIFSDPVRYNGKMVSIRGHIFTDYRHFSGIKDDACYKYTLSFGEVEVKPLGCESLDEALGNIVQRPKGRVFATIAGTIRHYPGEIPSVVIQAAQCSDVELEAD